MTGRVIHTGQAIVDLVMRVSALPPRGGDIFATDYQFLAGGGFNVIAAAARQDVTVEYAGGHGEGPFGDIVRSALAAEGVRLTSSPLPGIDTGFCVAVVDDGAERTFVSTLGAEGRTGIEAYAATAPTQEDVVYVSGYSLLHDGTGNALAQWLPHVTAKAVVFDPSPVIAEIPIGRLEATLRATTHLSLNVHEAAALTERLDLDSTDSGADTMAETLCRAIRATVIVRDGARGCCVATPRGASQSFPAPQVDAVDLNGAGDAHTGVLCAELLRGSDLAHAIERATVAAAVAVTIHGPATAPTSDELDEAVRAGLHCQS